jgi:hypothetical protein
MSQANDKRLTADDLTKSEKLARPPRVAPLYTAKDVAAVPYFDDEERLLAETKLLRSVEKYDNQPTITVATGAHDPHGATAIGAYGDAIRPLVTPTKADGHTVGGTILNLLVMQTHRHTRDECLLAGLARFAADRHAPGFKVHHYALLDFPESEVWSDEQRLMIRWSKAVLDNTMTDDLWRQAETAWGVKMCLRYIQFIGYFWHAGVRNRTLRVPYPMSTEAEGHVKPI